MNESRVRGVFDPHRTLAFALALAAACSSSDEAPLDSETDASSDGSDGTGSATANASETGDTSSSGTPGSTTATSTSGSSSTDAADESEGTSETDSGSDANGEPLYGASVLVTVELPGLGDIADIHRPDADGAFPVALMLQGANVDKQYYSELGSLVARYGFVVVIPNHESSGIAGSGLFMEQSVVVDALDAVEVLGNDGSSELFGRVDASVAGLLGHSYGGVVVVYALTGQCTFPFCTPPFTLPSAVKAGAFYGTNMRSPLGGAIPQLNNGSLGVALLQGTLDSASTPTDGLETFEAFAGSPTAYVSVLGANHYGNCDVDDPPGAAAENADPTLDQAAAVETAGRFSGLFLRAWVLGDADAAAYLAAPDDPNALVTLGE